MQVLYLSTHVHTHTRCSLKLTDCCDRISVYIQCKVKVTVFHFWNVELCINVVTPMKPQRQLVQIPYTRHIVGKL